MPHIFITVLTLIGICENDCEQNVPKACSFNFQCLRTLNLGWQLSGVQMKGDTEAKFPQSAIKMRKITDHTSQTRQKCVQRMLLIENSYLPKNAFFYGQANNKNQTTTVTTLPGGGRKDFILPSCTSPKITNGELQKK